MPAATVTSSSDPVVPDTRERLVRVAEELLAEAGPSGVTLREVARRAGLSHAAPLRHFPTLAALLAEVAAEGFRALQESVRKALESCGPAAMPTDRLAAAGRAYVDCALARSAVFAIMFRPDVYDPDVPEVADEGLAAFAQLQRVVEECQATGWRADEDPAALSGSTWALVHGFAMLWSQGAMQVVIGSEDLDRQLDVIFRNLELAPPMAPPKSRTAPRHRRKTR